MRASQLLCLTYIESITVLGSPVKSLGESKNEDLPID